MDTKRVETVGCRKAVVALTAALSCFLIYILACVFSPPSWSPDSSTIAILVTPPGDDPERSALFAYNVRTGKRILLDEAEGDSVLSTPAWSPDGRWIAYYRIDLPVSQEDEMPVPADSAADDPNSTADTTAQDAGRVPATPAPVEKPFSEQNRTLPPYVFDMIEGQAEEDPETLDVKLMVVAPDGKQKKTLGVFQWVSSGSSDDYLRILMVLRPEWSRDSQRLFYARGMSDGFYIGGLTLATGEVSAHLLSATGMAAISPDGHWLATLEERESDEALLSVARVDGTVQMYFRLDLEAEGGDDAPFLVTRLSWSPDSKLVLASVAGDLRIVDVANARIRTYRDPDAEETAYGVFSSQDSRFYYLAGYEMDDSESEAQKVVLKSHDVRTGRTRTVLRLSETPGISGLGQFSISPNGKIVALRCTLGADESEESALLLWDGKTRKVIETDGWLDTPVQ